MADPPAPAISSAVATGAASRTMARTIAAPVVRLGAELAGERPDVEGDHRAERDRDQHHRDAGDLGDEPALPQVLLPPLPHVERPPEPLEGDREHVARLPEQELHLADHERGSAHTVRMSVSSRLRPSAL